MSIRRSLLPSVVICASMVGCGRTECGPNTHEEDGVCVAGAPGTITVTNDPTCGAGTHLSDGACVADEWLEPGEFETPLVELYEAAGQQYHQHTDEMRYRRIPAADYTSPSGAGLLAVCALTSVSIMDASNPLSYSWAYLAQNLWHETPIGPRVEGGCVNLGWSDTDPNLVFTTHTGDIDHAAFLSGWNLNPSLFNPYATPFGPLITMDPVQLGVLQEPEVSYGGVDTANGHIYVAIHTGGLAVYDYDATNDGFTRIGTLTTGLSDTWSVRVRGTTAFVTDQDLGLVVVDVTSPEDPVVVGSAAMDSSAFGLALDSDRPDIVYVAAGAEGVDVFDVSDLANPTLLSNIPTPGLAMRVDQAANQLHVAAWRDARVYDVSDPATPRFIGARRFTVSTGGPDDGAPLVTTTVRGIAVAAETVDYYGVWNPDPIMLAGMWDYPVFLRVHDRPAPNLLLPEQVDHLDFGPVEAGTSAILSLPVTNQGTAPLTLYDNDIFADTTGSFSVAPHQLRIQPGETQDLQITYAPASTELGTAYLAIRSDDPDQPIREAYLVGNQPGLGVGQPAPEVEVDTVDGGQWSLSSAENVGQVRLLAYFATF